MIFLYPAFLWGLLAVAIPVAIHLFNFRRTKRVLFTNVAFLKEIETQKSSFRKLKHLLLMLTRVLVLGCLAIAFAQPFLKEDGAAVASQGVTGFYLDNSFSMQNEHNNKRFIDIATSSLDETMAIHRNLSSLQFVTNDFSAEEHHLITGSRFRDRLTSIELTPTARTWGEVYQRQKRLLDQVDARGPKTLYWVSDFQKSTAGDLSELKLDSTIQLNLIPVQTAEVRNVYVDSVSLDVPFLRKQQRNALRVRMRNSGTQAVENLPVRLILNDTQVSATAVDIPANGFGDFSFDFSLNQEGYVRGVISFDDFPVTFDNAFYFVLNASPVVRILHLYSGHLNTFDPVNRVYRDDSLFQLTHLNADNMDVGRFAVSDLVVLNGIERPTASMIAGVSKFVQEGGSLLVIPPLRPEDPSYKMTLEKLGVFGLRYQPSEIVPLKQPDVKLPFFQDVFEVSGKSEDQVNMPAAANVWSWSKAGNVLLSLRNDQPFLSQISSGKGKLYLLGAPLDESRGNFAQHAMFVPVMFKVAALSVKPRKTSYSFDDRAIELSVQGARPNTVFKLKYGESELIPVQRLVGNSLVLDIPHKGEVSGQSLAPGYFELVGEGVENGVIAVNLSQRESQLAYYSGSELRERFSAYPNVKVFDEITDGDLRSEFDRQASGTRLWKFFLYAALFFLLAEVLIIRFMKD
jgi:hypothetical protein